MLTNHLLRGQFQPFYSPADSGGSEGGNVDDFDQDMADLGGNDDDPPEEVEDDEPPVRKEKKDDEPEEEEEEVEEGDDDKKEGKKKSKGSADSEDESEGEEEEGEGEEDEEEAEEDEDAPVVGRPTAKQLKEAGVFKKFPALREIYFHHGEYAKVFNAPEEALEAVEKATHYDELEAAALAGDPKLILSELADNPKVFKAFVGKIVPTIRELDGGTFFEAFVSPIVTELLNVAFKKGEKLGPTTQQGRNLINSARHIADFVFNNGGEIPELKASEEKHPAEIELEKERQKSEQKEFASASSEVNGAIDKSLMGYVSASLDKRLTPIEREYVTDKILNEAIKEMSKDANHGIKLRGLWKRAKTAGYPKELKEAIINAQVARAKPILRELKEKHQAIALKGRRPAQREQQEEKPETQGPRKRQFSTQGRGGGSRNRGDRVLDSSKIDYARTSDADILNDNGGDRIKFKGR